MKEKSFHEMRENVTNLVFKSRIKRIAKFFIFCSRALLSLLSISYSLSFLLHIFRLRFPIRNSHWFGRSHVEISISLLNCFSTVISSFRKIYTKCFLRVYFVAAANKQINWLTLYCSHFFVVVVAKVKSSRYYKDKSIFEFVRHEQQWPNNTNNAKRLMT